MRHESDESQALLSHDVASAQSAARSEEHTSELQSHSDLVCRLLLEKKKNAPDELLLPRILIRVPPHLAKEPTTRSRSASGRPLPGDYVHSAPLPVELLEVARQHIVD